jgi:SAM-dependent methyltransferase
MSTEMTADKSSGRWAERAASLYDERYAKRYRDRDEELQAVQSNQALIDWLGSVCDRFDHPIDALDLGCGTGRYFWGVRRVASLTGLDASAPMLEEARHPIHADRLSAVPITLVHGDVMSHAFPEGSFDLVYSIGVLAEHVPLDRSVIDRVHVWLRPGGRFAFTSVHPQSPSVPRTMPRRLASAAVAALPAALTTALHRRLVGSGTYADERWITGVLAGKFIIESLERFSSDVHLHGRCVARKTA